jgi:hypothetical protein
MERYRVGESSMFLATRERGRRMREEVEGLLAKVAPGGALVLDFSGVEGITVSFGDELVAKLILGRESGDFADRGMVIEGAGEDVWETLESVLARRKLAAACLNASAQPEMLGEQSWLRQTLAAALELQTFNATQLAARVGITPQAANNRLRVLVASGAVAKERAVPEGGGKEFSYKAVIPAHA